MMRFLAKFLIQYYYDLSSSQSISRTPCSDPLPRWLRSWTQRNAELLEFELELVRLESKLVSQSESHLRAWSWSSHHSKQFAIANSAQIRSRKLNPISMAVLAAGLAGVLLSAGWYIWKSGTGSQNPGEIVANEANNTDLAKNEMKPSDEQVRRGREKWMQSTWEVTRRLASGLQQKSGQANQTLAFINQSTLEEEIRKVGTLGLRFVATKLPQATVRMIGMNSKATTASQ